MTERSFCLNMTHFIKNSKKYFKILSEIKCYYPLLKTKKMRHKNDVLDPRWTTAGVIPKNKQKWWETLCPYSLLWYRHPKCVYLSTMGHILEPLFPFSTHTFDPWIHLENKRESTSDFPLAITPLGADKDEKEQPNITQRPCNSSWSFNQHFLMSAVHAKWKENGKNYLCTSF